MAFLVILGLVIGLLIILGSFILIRYKYLISFMRGGLIKH